MNPILGLQNCLVHGRLQCPIKVAHLPLLKAACDWLLSVPDAKTVLVTQRRDMDRRQVLYLLKIPYSAPGTRLLMTDRWPKRSVIEIQWSQNDTQDNPLYELNEKAASLTIMVQEEKELRYLSFARGVRTDAYTDWLDGCEVTPMYTVKGSGYPGTAVEICFDDPA